ncbi:hypothetical protein [Dyella jiangningensis]|jgi:hypothetical protein
MKNKFKICLSKVGCLPIIRLPAAGNVFHGNNDSKKFFAEGVDGTEKRCKMGGSLGTKCSKAETATFGK